MNSVMLSEKSASRSLSLIIVVLLWTFNAILRVLFGVMGASGVELLDVEVSRTVMDFISLMCLSLGASGLVMSVGLWQMNGS